MSDLAPLQAQITTLMTDLRSMRSELSIKVDTLTAEFRQETKEVQRSILTLEKRIPDPEVLRDFEIRLRQMEGAGHTKEIQSLRNDILDSKKDNEELRNIVHDLKGVVWKYIGVGMGISIAVSVILAVWNSFRTH